MSDVDLSRTIAPKSDQLNADDLIGGPRTITITKVRLLAEPEQPVAIFFEGDNGKPYKPGKSMRRLMVMLWGGDGNAYVGRSMTIYRDGSVMFGGVKVGGIRISHMSHINEEKTVALTASKAQRKPFTVKPLRDAPRPANPGPQGGSRDQDGPKDPAEKTALTGPPDSPAAKWADGWDEKVRTATDGAALGSEFNAALKAPEWLALREEDEIRAGALKQSVIERVARLKAGA